ncbi:MAG: regulatory protein RecX [Bacteroidota bacterium]
MHEDYDIMLEKARRYCLRGEKSLHDVRQKLYQWQTEKSWHDKILNTLVEERFVDEERFARSFARDKCFLSKWGKVKIRYALRQKQIPDHQIEAAFEEIEDERYRKVFLDVAEQKLRSLHKKSSDPREIKQKLMRFLAQRGFELSLLDESNLL